MRDYATVAEPLMEPLKKNLPEMVEWSATAEQLFG